MTTGNSRRARHVFSDLLTNRPSPTAQSVRGGDVFIGQDVLPTVSICRVNAAGTKQWVDLASSAVSGWAKYVVSNDPAIVAPYATIGAAITDYVTDGGGAAQPAFILVHAGTYIENVVLQPGVRLIAFGASRNNAVTIAGNVTFSPVVDSTADLSDITVTGELTIGGANVVRFNVFGCLFTGASGGAPILLSNTNAASNVLFSDSNAVSAQVGIAVISAAAYVGSFSWARGSLTAVTAADTLMNLGALTSVFQTLDLTGRIVPAGGTHSFRRCNQTAVGARVFQMSAAAVVSFEDGVLTCDQTIIVAGTGTWRERGARRSVGSITVEETVTQSPLDSDPQLTRTTLGVGPTVLTYTQCTDIVEIAPAGGAGGVTLPDVIRFSDGRRLRVIHTSTTGTVTVTSTNNIIQDPSQPVTTILLWPGWVLDLVADTVNNTWRVVAWSGPMPASPTLFVSSGGVDTATGLSAAPLATVTEALKRMGITGWTGQPTISIVNTLASVANPVWSIPTPVGAASPILIQGTLAVAATGQLTAATASSNTANPTFTLNIAGTLNQYKGQLIQFTSGILNGGWRPIASNTNAANTVVTTPGFDTLAVGGDSFNIVNRVGIYQFTGQLIIIGNGTPLLIDALSLSLGSTVYLDGVYVQETRNKFLTTGTCGFNGTNFTWVSGTIQSGVGTLEFTAGSTIPSCGSRYDGTPGLLTIGGGQLAVSAPGLWNLGSGTFEAVAVQNATSTQSYYCNGCRFDGCGIGAAAGWWMLAGSTFSACFKNAGNTAAIQVGLGCFFRMQFCNVINTLAASDVFNIASQSCSMLLGVIGANPLANANAVQLKAPGSLSQIFAGSVSANTVTGGTAGADIMINGEPAISWAELATLGSAVSGLAPATGMIVWGGGAVGAAGTTIQWCGQSLPVPTMSNTSVVALLTPISPARRALKLRVKPTVNSLTGNAVFVLQKNGVDTAITLTIPTTSTVLASDTTHTVVFADGDNFDLKLTITTAAAQEIQFTASMEIV